MTIRRGWCRCTARTFDALDVVELETVDGEYLMDASEDVGFCFGFFGVIARRRVFNPWDEDAVREVDDDDAGRRRGETGRER